MRDLRRLLLATFHPPLKHNLTCPTGLSWMPVAFVEVDGNILIYNLYFVACLYICHRCWYIHGLPRNCDLYLHRKIVATESFVKKFRNWFVNKWEPDTMTSTRLFLSLCKCISTVHQYVFPLPVLVFYCIALHDSDQFLNAIIPHGVGIALHLHYTDNSSIITIVLCMWWKWGLRSARCLILPLKYPPKP